MGAAQSTADDDVDRLLHHLEHGKIEVVGQFVWGSNYTFLAKVIDEGREIQGVYKPSQGEQPLWDFPEGTLAAREAAAYVACHALGWDLVPPTVLRDEGPTGPGSLQLYVDADPERHFFTFTPQERQRLRPVAAFDLLVNNADRKGGHVLLSPDEHVWLIDHGLCFNVEDKLRTVIWDFAGEPIPEGVLADIETFRRRLQPSDPLWGTFESLLSLEETQALAQRASRLSRTRRFPLPGPGRPYPWPLV
jgi:uncharacterized repeat protein (TIGR03843 family)